MILTVDVGNTNIVIGCAEPGSRKIIFEERLYTDRHKSDTEYATSAKSILDLYNISPSDLEGGILSSSVPPVTEPIRRGLEKLLGKKIIEVGPGIKTGVDIKLDDPSSLGADLLVGAVAGISYYGSPLILIDMGTATTISIINNEKRFMGGMIIPGIEVSLAGLARRAAHLPEVAIKVPGRLIGGNTVGAMQSGSIYGHASCIDGMIDRIWDELGYKTAIVATGGFAGIVIPCCKHEITLDDSLLIKGLTILFEKNTKHK
ncbi:MAG: type III pantothenate kinase [Lachnospiraceae bacterium]|nr:type III pantothenate kinase [Lachnospiraceae bacterium]MBR6908973.1 type III pantothenate kinase [Lachnospiraceae bacterium]